METLTEQIGSHPLVGGQIDFPWWVWLILMLLYAVIVVVFALYVTIDYTFGYIDAFTTFPVLFFGLPTLVILHQIGIITEESVNNLRSATFLERWF